VADTRTHRGPHPEDSRLFAPEAVATLRRAAADLAWLADRGYAADSSLKLVGDRYRLVARQRVAVARCVCSADERGDRLRRKLPPEAVARRPLWIDGYNVLTTVEAALAGGVVLAACDTCYRDMASMHGSYRKVAETHPALKKIGRVLAELQVAGAVWYLDRPVSNSGRLKSLMLQVAAEHDWPWQVELVADPDRVLVESSEPVASADSAVLDACGPWLNLARLVVDRRVPDARVIDLPAAAHAPETDRSPRRR
jgi:hypothetical protein